MRKKKVIEIVPDKFVILNKDAKYFAGMRYGQVYWSSFFEEAKEFNNVEKTDVLFRYESHQCPEIVYLKDL